LARMAVALASQEAPLEVSCRQNNRLLVNRLGKMQAGSKPLATILRPVFCL
jgi:hypothetical protein